MSSFLIALPILLPLLIAVTGLFLPLNLRYQKVVALLGAVSLTGVAGVLLVQTTVHKIGVLHLGAWSAPWGIPLVADYLSASMIAVSALVYLAVVWYSLKVISDELTKKFFFPLISLLMMGVNGAFLTGDLFNLYVCFEVMLIASFVLMVMGGSRNQLEGGFKYVIINIFASFIFLAGIGILYGKVGSLNMADISRLVSVSEDSAAINTTVVFLLVAFGIKSAVFPLFFWLPASYHTLPTPIVALFAGLLTKVGVYSYLRSLSLLFSEHADRFTLILLVVAALTMVTGVLGAASKFDIKRILSFHIISQIGYILFAIALMTEFAIAAAIFYTIHHILVKSNLFLVGGLISHRFAGSNLKPMGGLLKTAPYLAILFAIPALSLGGIPPLSGFWAKLAVIRGAVEADVVWIAVVAVGVGVLTLYSMTKIWAEAFWKSPAPIVQESDAMGSEKMGVVPPRGPSILLAVVTLLIGLFPELLMSFSIEAAKQLLNQNFYIEAVLNS